MALPRRGAATSGVLVLPETRVHVEGGTIRGCEQGVLAHDFDAEGVVIEACRWGAPTGIVRIPISRPSLRGCRIERNENETGLS